MSYVLLLAAKARRGMAVLPFEVQEAVYDRLDILTARPELVVARKGTGSIVDDFVVRLDGGLKYSVFMSVSADHMIRRITLLRIGHAVETESE